MKVFFLAITMISSLTPAYAGVTFKCNPYHSKIFATDLSEANLMNEQPLSIVLGSVPYTYKLGNYSVEEKFSTSVQVSYINKQGVDAGETLEFIEAGVNPVYASRSREMIDKTLIGPDGENFGTAMIGFQIPISMFEGKKGIVQLEEQTIVNVSNVSGKPVYTPAAWTSKAYFLCKPGR